MAGDFPYHNIREGAPPTIVFLGSEDKLIPVRTAQAYEAKMKKVGAICKTHIYEGQPHGFFNEGRSKDPNYFNMTVHSMDKFLVDLDWLEGKPTIAPK